MSKSGGGFTTLQSLIDAGVHPLAYRLLCLSAHYRSELEFSGDAVAAALTRLKRLVMTIERLPKVADPLAFDPDTAAAGRIDAAIVARLDAAISDDLSTPLALPLLEEFLADKRLDAPVKRDLLATFDAVLGLNLSTLTRVDLRVAPVGAVLTPLAIEARLDERQEARAAKDFARSDAIRDGLIADGVEVMDGDPLRWEWSVAL